MVEETFLASSSSSSSPPDTDCGGLFSLQCMIHIMGGGGRRQSAERVEGFWTFRRTGTELLRGSHHGTVRSLHLEELDDEGGASCDDLGRQVAEGTVLDAHDGQFAAEGQLEGEAVQVWVVVEVQFL